MDSAEFTEWAAYDRIDPFGEERADLRMGIALASYHNSQHPDNDFVPRDFMPFLDDPDEGQSIEDQLRVMERIAAAQAAIAKQAKVN